MIVSSSASSLSNLSADEFVNALRVRRHEIRLYGRLKVVSGSTAQTRKRFSNHKSRKRTSRCSFHSSLESAIKINSWFTCETKLKRESGEEVSRESRSIATWILMWWEDGKSCNSKSQAASIMKCWEVFCPTFSHPSSPASCQIEIEKLCVSWLSIEQRREFFLVTFMPPSIGLIKSWDDGIVKSFTVLSLVVLHLMLGQVKRKRKAGERH